MAQIDPVRTDYALTFLTDTARDSDINPDQITKCHAAVADELSALRNALTWIRRHIEAAKSEDDINIDEIHDMAKF